LPQDGEKHEETNMDLESLRCRFEEFLELTDDDATAAALLMLSEQVGRLAHGMRALGTGGAATDMGAIECLAKEVRDASERIASAIGDVVQG
jgi:hypothetical protein